VNLHRKKGVEFDSKGKDERNEIFSVLLVSHAAKQRTGYGLSHAFCLVLCGKVFQVSVIIWLFSICYVFHPMSLSFSSMRNHASTTVV